MYVTFTEILPTETSRDVKISSVAKDDNEKVSTNVDETEKDVKRYQNVIETGKSCMNDARQPNGKDQEVINHAIFLKSLDLLKMLWWWWTRFY